MADLYGNNSPSSAPETEEISSFLDQLHQNPSSSSSSKFIHRSLSYRATAGNSYSINFSDPGSYFAKEIAENDASSTGLKRIISVEHDLGDLSCDSEKDAEVPSETPRPRSSSKRSRAAEFHNLSEKVISLRTFRIVPNSNKTDKASMIDEVIEYLKQLQLQVQMLTMRNGLSLQPICLTGTIQPLQLPVTGMSFDEGNGLLNTNSTTRAFSENVENSAQPAICQLPNRNRVSNQPIILPSPPSFPSSDTSFGC